MDWASFAWGVLAGAAGVVALVVVFIGLVAWAFSDDDMGLGG